MGQAQGGPVDIYGPEGLRMWLRVAIRYSVSRIVPQYRVHEILEIPMAPEWEYNTRTQRYYYNHDHSASEQDYKILQDATSWTSIAPTVPLEANAQYGEIPGGRSIYPTYNHPLCVGNSPIWLVEQETDVAVYAAPASHGIPSLSYVVKEAARPGRLRDDVVDPIVKRNIDGLVQAGYKIPMKTKSIIKNMLPDESFTFPDGTIITQQEAVEPPRQGRTIVLSGDTANARSILKLGYNASILVHEATNTWLSGIDKGNAREVGMDARTHGHSTPQMAGTIARAIRADTLVLNHFSARYKGDDSLESLGIMMRIEDQAREAAKMNETQVVAAWDLMVLSVPSR
jgi:ribonuclease Z